MNQANLVILITLLTIGCRTRNEFNTRSTRSDENSHLIQQLHINQQYIISVRDSLNQLITSRDDKITPTNYLVYEGRAKFIKAQAKQALENYPRWNRELQSLVKVVESCARAGVEWDVYCFKDMPYFGVEPILNVWIRQYELALNAMTVIK